ncbi:hypothetical protein BESB_002070 [Besnoitia besnoiti]|uniref:AP2/ERF domain-containing protein n=1 Tax=Besnoitia besnoiti TaxID=94643 RepID=A0A2A9MNN9_BESBE|nr:hypothetical protein BESB_002070 [Besnoitia besnoiti]PFH37866.1 hypothetical protein BESB_002070 [Besnoitia besnoiti]
MAAFIASTCFFASSVLLLPVAEQPCIIVGDAEERPARVTPLREPVEIPPLLASPLPVILRRLFPCALRRRQRTNLACAHFANTPVRPRDVTPQSCFDARHPTAAHEEGISSRRLSSRHPASTPPPPRSPAPPPVPPAAPSVSSAASPPRRSPPGLSSESSPPRKRSRKCLPHRAGGEEPAFSASQPLAASVVTPQEGRLPSGAPAVSSGLSLQQFGAPGPPWRPAFGLSWISQRRSRQHTLLRQPLPEDSTDMLTRVRPHSVFWQPPVFPPLPAPEFPRPGSPLAPSSQRPALSLPAHALYSSLSPSPPSDDADDTGRPPESALATPSTSFGSPGAAPGWRGPAYPRSLLAPRDATSSRSPTTSPHRPFTLPVEGSQGTLSHGALEGSAAAVDDGGRRRAVAGEGTTSQSSLASRQRGRTVDDGERPSTSARTGRKQEAVYHSPTAQEGDGRERARAHQPRLRRLEMHVPWVAHRVVPWYVWFYPWRAEPRTEHWERCKPSQACWFLQYSCGGRKVARWMTKEEVGFYWNVQALRAQNRSAAKEKATRRWRREYEAARRGLTTPPFRQWRDTDYSPKVRSLAKESAMRVRYLQKQGLTFPVPAPVVNRLLEWEPSDSSDDEFEPPGTSEWKKYKKK